MAGHVAVLQRVSCSLKINVLQKLKLNKSILLQFDPMVCTSLFLYRDIMDDMNILVTLAILVTKMKQAGFLYRRVY